MDGKEWSKIWYNPQLDIELFQAVYIKNGFPLHMHEHYVICLIENGVQSFTHRGTKYVTPAGGLNILNPEDAHTGEPKDEYGFEFRSLYPTISHMREVVYEMTGQWQNHPFFPDIQINDLELAPHVRALHLALTQETPLIEQETLFLTVLTKLIMKYSDIRSSMRALKSEKNTVQKACHYIRECVTEGVTLTQLAAHVGLSRYHLLRVFHKEVGMPPHAYLESVRINKAKQFLEQGLSLTEVAYETGFSDQSHFSNRFKRMIGVTPGQYAQELRD